MQRITIKDHPFDLLGVVEHFRQDGQATKLYHWRSGCAHAECDASWEFKTTALNRAGDLVPPDDPSRHYRSEFSWKFCQKHRPKTQRKTYATTYQSRRLVSDADVASMRELAKTYKGTRKELYGAMSLLFGVTPGSAREILAGRRRAPAPQHRDRACTTTGGLR